MFNEGDKVVARDGAIGIVKSVSDGSGGLAKGYFVKFDDFPMRVFMMDGVCELFDINKHVLPGKIKKIKDETPKEYEQMRLDI